MPKDKSNPYVGIASIIGCSVVLLVLASMFFAPQFMGYVKTISAFLVVLGILLGFFQYSTGDSVAEKKPTQRKRK